MCTIEVKAAKPNSVCYLTLVQCYLTLVQCYLVPACILSAGLSSFISLREAMESKPCDRHTLTCCV